MTGEEMKHLRIGDVIRHKSLGSKQYVVTANFGDRVTAVHSIDVTNPIEWDIVLTPRGLPFKEQG